MLGSSRAVLGVVIATVLASCTVAMGPDAKNAAAQSEAACTQSASQPVALLASTPDYVVETRAFPAPTPANADIAAVAASNPCAGATVVLTVRKADDGALVHAFANAMNRMELIEGHAGPSFDDARLAAFVGAWAKTEVAATDSAPAALSQTVATTLDAAAYAALRAKKAPMLCHATSAHERACFSVDADDPYALKPFFTEDQS